MESVLGDVNDFIQTDDDDDDKDSSVATFNTQCIERVSSEAIH